MSRTSFLSVPLVSTLLLGCATVRPPLGPAPPGPPPVPLRDVEVRGRPYALSLRGAVSAPSGHRGSGGRIEGQVCGVRVALQVEHHGGPILIEGTVANLDSEIWVGEDDGDRVFSGTLGDRSFDLRLDREGLSGNLGTRLFELYADADMLAGSAGLGGSFAITGLDALRRTPAVLQGTLLPLLLACVEARGRKDPVLARASFGNPSAD